MIDCRGLPGFNWNNASTGWFTPDAENDLREGGRLLWRMEAKDGSAGFDFSGTYTIVEPHSLIEYNLDDGRRVRVEFEPDGKGTVGKRCPLMWMSIMITRAFSKKPGPGLWKNSKRSARPEKTDYQ